MDEAGLRSGSVANETVRSGTTYSISGLSPDTLYYVRVESHRNGTAQVGLSEVRSTRTQPLILPTVTGVTVGSVVTYSAAATVALNNPQSRAATVYLRYQPTPVTAGNWTTPTSNTITTSTTSAIFDSELGGVFTSGTEYTLQVSTSSTFATSQEATFTTRSLPVVASLAVTDVTHNAATFTATIENGYGAELTVNFQYRTGNSGSWTDATAKGTGSATYAATGLTPDTAYSVQAWAGGNSGATTVEAFDTLAEPVFASVWAPSSSPAST